MKLIIYGFSFVLGGLLQLSELQAQNQWNFTFESVLPSNTACNTYMGRANPFRPVANAASIVTLNSGTAMTIGCVNRPTQKVLKMNFLLPLALQHVGSLFYFKSAQIRDDVCQKIKNDINTNARRDANRGAATIFAQCVDRWTGSYVFSRVLVTLNMSVPQNRSLTYSYESDGIFWWDWDDYFALEECEDFLDAYIGEFGRTIEVNNQAYSTSARMWCEQEDWLRDLLELDINMPESILAGQYLEFSSNRHIDHWICRDVIDFLNDRMDRIDNRGGNIDEWFYCDDHTGYSKVTLRVYVRQQQP